jgi:ParB family chromosome partitioning protein
MRTPRKAQALKEAAAGSLGELEVIPLHLVEDPELPARETMDVDAMNDLIESLKAVGLLSPIVVRRRGGGFEVVAGHRRLLAARSLLWPTIRAMVYPEGWEDATAAMVHENVIREQLNAAQEAVLYAQLLDKHKLDEEGLCRLVKRSPSYIGDRLQLLRLDEKVFQAVRSGQISFSVARVLNRFTDEVMRRYYLEQAIRSGTSSRVVDQWWNDWKAQAYPGVQRIDPNMPISAAAAAEPSPGIECFLCGGNRDPYNLVSVLIHKWELTEIRRMLKAGVMEAEAAAGQLMPEAETADKPNGGVK